MELASYILGKKSGGGSTPTGTINITENGTTNVTNYATANVNVQPDLETKSVTITENTTTTITPTTGKDGMSSVSITTNVVDPRWATMGVRPVGVNDWCYQYSLELMQNYDTTITSWFIRTTYGYFTPSTLTNAYPNTYLLKYLPLINTSNVTNMSSAFRNNYSLEVVAPIDTSNVTDMSNMFANCQGLTYVPVLNMSSVTNITDMFSNCNCLSSEGMDNVLQMCINAVNITPGTLSTIGLGNNKKFPLSRFENLPHWQDFLDAGWSYNDHT